jgi:hypothetical protein
MNMMAHWEYTMMTWQFGRQLAAAILVGAAAAAKTSVHTCRHVLALLKHSVMPLKYTVWCHHLKLLLLTLFNKLLLLRLTLSVSLSHDSLII